MQGSIKKEGTSWRYVLDLPRGPNGRRRQQKRRGFKTRQSAEAELQEAMRRLSDGVFVEPSKVTLEAYLSDQWLPAVKATLRPSTFDSYNRNMRLHVVPTLGKVKLQSLTTPMLNTLYGSLQDKGLSAKTARHIHTTLRKSLADATKWGVVQRNVAIAADPPKVPRHEMETWSAEEVRTFLTFVADDPIATAFILAATTGMRRGEVLGLRWRDVDLDLARLTVVQTLTSVNYVLHFGQPKTNRGRRSIPLDQTTVMLLRQHRARQNANRLVMGADWADLDLVMTKPDGSPVHPDTVSDTFDRRVHACGLRKIRLHDLRHTYATLALGSGIPVKVVSEVLGHSSSAFTMDTYGHVTPVMMEDLARTVGALMFRGQASS
jgi:integrase